MLKPVSRLNVKIAPATVQAAKPAQPARPLCSVRRILSTPLIDFCFAVCYECLDVERAPRDGMLGG